MKYLNKLSICHDVIIPFAYIILEILSSHVLVMKLQR